MTTELLSVTSALKAGLGISQGLQNWAVKTTAEAAYDKHTILDAYRQDNDRDAAIKWLTGVRYTTSDKAMARGADLHNAAEARAIGKAPDIDPANKPLLDQYDLFLEAFRPEFLLAESPVYNIHMGYAGTLDAIMRIDGRTLIADIKTTDKLADHDGSRPPYPEVALQLAAYRNCTEVGLLAERREINYKRWYVYDPAAHHEPMPHTDGAVVLVISPDDYRLIPVNTDQRIFRFFRHVLECARFQMDVSRTVFGPPLTPVYDIFGAEISAIGGTT